MANGYVRYGNSIHLDGFQILDFCIENAISLESLSDLNLGRKVFLTGNDTNAGYLRENVWDGDRWRAAAYLDDLTTFKDEDFNKLKEKVDTLIGDGVDMDGIIESWKEVEAFLAGMSDTKNLMTMLNGKVDHVINMATSAYKTLGYGRPDEGWQYYGPAISFGTNTYFVQIQVNHQADQVVFRRHTNQGFSDWKKILHEGNVGEYALKVDGSNAMTGDLQLLTISSGSVNVAVTEGLFIYRGPSSGGTDVGLPDNYINVFNVGGTNAYSNLQLAWRRDYPNPALYARIGESSAYSDWKTIAFTDSDITGNAATATKLKDKVSLWGNEFDGTQSLSTANIYLANSKGVYGITTDSKYIIALNISSDNVLRVGYGTNYGNETIDTSVDGYNIYFRTGAKHTAMTITDEGNVLVGDAYGENIKFTVKGGASICTGFHRKINSSTENVNKPSEINKDYSFSIIRGYDNRYGLHTWIKSDGQTFLQSCKADGEQDECYALNLNPLGGAVNVGEGGLNVNGTIKSGDKFILTTTSMNLGSATTPLYLFLARPDANYIWASTNGGYINLGVYDTGTTNSANATLSIYSDRVVSGQRNNAVSLGTSSYRWSNVYSVGGNFSGRVLIGGAVDDEESALQVKGRAKFISNEWHTESTIVNHAGLLLYGRNEGDYVQGMRFYGYDKTPLGHIAYYRGYFYIGKNQDTTWFYINSTESCFDVATTFNGGALIPTGQKLTIGSVTFEEDAAGRVKVDGDMYTTGTLASGGKAKEGTGTGSGSANVRDFELPADEKTTYDCDHLLNTKNVIVQVFEKAIQGNIEVWEMILTDVTIVTEDRVTVTFGRPTNKVHKVHIIGGNVS